MGRPLNPHPTETETAHPQKGDDDVVADGVREPANGARRRAHALLARRAAGVAVRRGAAFAGAHAKREAGGGHGEVRDEVYRELVAGAGERVRWLVGGAQREADGAGRRRVAAVVERDGVVAARGVLLDGELADDKLLSADFTRTRKDCSIPAAIEFRDDSFCPKQTRYGSDKHRQLRLGITHS